MIEKTFKSLLLFILLGMSNHALDAMEESKAIETSATPESPKEITRAKRRRQNRKKKKSYFNENYNVIDIKRLEHFIENGDLPKLLNFTSSSIEDTMTYIKQLNLLANIILMQKSLIADLKIVAGEIGIILESFSEDKAYCLSIREDGIGICGHTKDELGKNTTRILSSLHIQQLALGITKSLLATDMMCTKKNYQRCCELIVQHDSKDMEIFARYTKRLMDYHYLKNRILLFNKNFYNLISKLVINLQSIISTDELQIDDEDISYEEILNELIPKAKLHNAYKEIVPYFFSLQNHINHLLSKFRETTPDITAEIAKELFNDVADIIQWWNPVKEIYEKLYCKIILELQKIIRYIPASYETDAIELAQRVFLYLPLKSKKLPQNLVDDELSIRFNDTAQKSTNFISKPNIIDIQTIKSLIENGDFKNIFNLGNKRTTETKLTYLKKLNFLANLILFQQWVITTLRTIIINMQMYLKERRILNPIYYLSIRDDGKSLCGHLRDEAGDNTTKIILSPKAIALAEETTLHLLLDPKLGHKKIAEYWDRSCKIFSDINQDTYDEDAFIVATYNKYLINNKRMHSSIRSFLLTWQKTVVSAAKNLDYSIESANYFNLLIHLCKNKLSEIEDLPGNGLVLNLKSLCSKLNSWSDKFYHAQLPLTLETATELCELAEDIIEWWKPSHIYNEILYAQISSAQDEVIKAQKGLFYKADLMKVAKIGLLHPLNKTLPKNLDEDLGMKNTQEDARTEQDLSNNFLDKSILSHNKIPKNPLQKKHKKRSRNRRRKRSQPVNEEPEYDIIIQGNSDKNPIAKNEHIKFPHYADRIISRFNAIPNIEDLYHTFSPIADAFIIKYGKSIQQQNETFPDQLDTRYYMNGKIEYSNGNIIFVEFGITLTENQICYHRGFKNPREVNQPEELNDIKYESNFSTLVSNDDAYVAARLQFTAENDEIYGNKRVRQNSKCIEIEDERNEVIITLFKTQNNNTLS